MESSRTRETPANNSVTPHRRSRSHPEGSGRESTHQERVEPPSERGRQFYFRNPIYKRYKGRDFRVRLPHARVDPRGPPGDTSQGTYFSFTPGFRPRVKTPEVGEPQSPSRRTPDLRRHEYSSFRVTRGDWCEEVVLTRSLCTRFPLGHQWSKSSVAVPPDLGTR